MDAQAQLKDRDCLHEEDGPWRRTMQTLTAVVRPVREEINRTLVSGDRRARNLYDATGIVANNNLGSAVYGSASNPADKWFELGTDDPEFDKWPKANSALQIYSKRTLASYGPSWSPFYAQSFPLYLDVSGLGEGYFYQALRFDRQGSVDGFVDKCIPLSEAVYRVDDDGRVTHFYRRFSVTLEAADKLAKSQGGELSKRAQEKLKEKPQETIEIQHSVYPNDGYDPERLGSQFYAFASCYVEVAEKFEISRKGYEEMPYTVPAWERAAGERHGRGAGEMALADILSVNVMQRDNLAGGAWASNPPWGAPHDANLNFARLRPGAIVPGSIDMRGNQILKRIIESSSSVPFSLEMTNQLRQAIKDAFEGAAITIVPANRTGMTPTEVLDVREEKFRRMAPYQGNLTAGHLDPHVRRRFALLSRQGIFRDVQVPKELAGKALHPKFKSPMALAQDAARAGSALRAATAMGQAAQMDPSVLDRFNGDMFSQIVMKGYGVADMMNDDDAADARRKSREQQQHAAAMAQIAETAAGAAQKGADAAATLRAPAPGA